MLKNFLYIIIIVLLLVSAYFIYQWHISDINNKEPLPALISSFATIVMAIITWLFDGKQNDKINVSSVEGGSHVDVDPKKNTDITVKKVKDNSTVLIGKGKESLSKIPPRKIK
jgi:hypothetical protein